MECKMPSSNLSWYKLETPIGNIFVEADDAHIYQISYDKQPTKKNLVASKTVKQLDKQLKLYFKNPNYDFDLPMKLHGTELQKKIWKCIHAIPHGKTLTYSDIAKKVKTHPRVVGNACRANPIPLVIPCHRVTAKNHLGGYSGETSGRQMDKKIWLLTHENIL